MVQRDGAGRRAPHRERCILLRPVSSCRWIMPAWCYCTPSRQPGWSAAACCMCRATLTLPRVLSCTQGEIHRPARRTKFFMAPSAPRWLVGSSWLSPHPGCIKLAFHAR